jgi:hypothetical protein
VPLESCPVCGYALSIADHHCRHCRHKRAEIPDRRTVEKHFTTVNLLAVVLLLGTLAYFVFFH